MPSSTRTAGSASQTPTSGTFDWKTPGGAVASGAQIQAALAASDGDADYVHSRPEGSVVDPLTKALQLTGFGFAIPSGATDLFVQAAITHRVTGNGGFTVDEARLIVGGSVAGNDVAGSGVAVSNTTYATLVLGSSSSDSWGVGLTPSQANAANFGLQLVYGASQAAGGGTLHDIRVTHVELTIHYTLAGRRRAVAAWVA